jgi:hypothetical protein
MTGFLLQVKNQKLPISLTSEHRLFQLIQFSTVYSEWGRWDTARDIQQEIVNIQKVKAGPENPNTITAMANLSWSYWNLS